ncbi:hypothetical protein RYX36_031020 [Vicia faba]
MKRNLNPNVNHNQNHRVKKKPEAVDDAGFGRYRRKICGAIASGTDLVESRSNWGARLEVWLQAYIGFFWIRSVEAALDEWLRSKIFLGVSGRVLFADSSAGTGASTVHGKRGEQRRNRRSGACDWC